MVSTSTVLRSSSLVLLLAAGACSPTEPGPPEGTDDFSRNTLGSYDLVALGAPGDWEIRGGSLRATGPADQSVLIRKGETFLDGWVETRSTRADDGGLVLRFAGESQYYLLAFRDDAAPPPRGDLNLAVYRRVGTEFTELARRDIDWPRGEGRTIRFEAAGAVLRVLVDGVLIGEVEDPVAALPAGRPGLRHYGATDAWETQFEVFQWREVAP